MSKSIIIFGGINKKLLLPFFLSLAQIILVIINENYPEKENNLVLQMYMLALGEMSIKLLPLVLKTSDKENNKEKIIKKRKCFHYFLLCFLFMMDVGLSSAATLVDYYFKGGEVSYTDSNLFPNHNFLIQSIEMIFIVVISKLLLKYHYFKHHLISIIILVVFGIVCDIVLNKFKDIDGYFFIIQITKIFQVAVQATFYCYEKYMMERLFYPYWNIAFVPGFFMFCFGTVFLLLALINPDKENSKTAFISSFYKYFQDESTGLIIGRLVLVFILHVIMCPLSILIIFYFSPEFILIIFQLSSFIKNIIINPTEKLYCIVFYIILFIALMIHLEILELNFCGLNKYTKRNIDLRGLEDVLGEGRDSTVGTNAIDINKDYLILKEDKNENGVEMYEQTGETLN